MRLKVFLFTFLLTGLILFWWKVNQTEKIVLVPEVPVATMSAERTKATVVRLVDGDTVQVKVDGKTETIRLIGMDAPESVDPKKTVQCFGVEASNKAKELLSDKDILLEADVTQGDQDTYHRRLRYIFLPDGTNFSEVMIAGGFAREYDYYGKPYKYRDEFKQAQIEAKSNKNGLWADGACSR